MDGTEQLTIEYIFSIDICQFSVSSLFNSSEDKSRSISFRSIILIMVYAGTIILNLLAASVDSSLSTIKNLSPENSTVTAAKETMEKHDSVQVLLANEACKTQH